MLVEILLQRMNEINRIADEIPDRRFLVLSRFLFERITKPESYVVMLGETSSGKTTLINGLLGKEMLKTSASPTTGTVIEIMDDPDLIAQEYYAINKDATVEELSPSMFEKLSLHPDKDLLRLRSVIPAFPHELSGLRLFDTPGYGSIQEEHDEVLKEFIPNSDIIVYVVSYRIGFKENDHYFMQFISQLIDSDTELILVVNRVPECVSQIDNRVREIKEHAEDCLHRELCCHIVHSIYREGEATLPRAESLWDDIKESLESEERQSVLHSVFLSYQKSLLLDMKGYLEKEIIAQRVTQEERQQLCTSLDEFLAKESVALGKIVTVFARLDGMLDKLFAGSKNELLRKTCSEVDVVNKWTDKDECVGFVQAHILQLQTRNETKKIAGLLQDELERLDDEIHSLLNTAVKDFQRSVELKSPIYKQFILNIGNRTGQRATEAGLTAFFKQYGGAGGAGAGVANAAKKGLKKLGELLGKKFSRETHNALAKFLKRFGATSTRSIAVAAVVIVEGVSYIVDANTWQKTLKKQAEKAFELWRSETVSNVRRDLHELKKHNLEKIHLFFEEYRENCEFQKTNDNGNITIERVEKWLGQIDHILNGIEIFNERNVKNE